MSECPLPEDLDRWPEDPFKLLGVSRTVSPRDLRRAYTRLIRTWKPEQFPAHFRRIREAYENAQRYVEWFAPSPEDAPPFEPEDRPAEEPSSPSEPAPTESTRGETASPAPAEWVAPRPTPQERDPWEVAVEGREEQAYRLLLEESQRHPGRQETYLRLYWLLALNPVLDAGRIPNDWLVEGLRATGWAGPLRELYRHAIADDPTEALSERCDRLLGGEAAAPRLVELIDWRWEALVRLRRWDVLQADLGSLRERLVREDETGWVRLVLGLMDRLAWSAEPAVRHLWQTCTQEVNSHPHLSLKLSGELDRLELLQRIAAAWHILQGRKDVPPLFLEFISASWHRPWAEVRGQVMAFLHQIRQQPRGWLAKFDIFKGKGNAVLEQFGELLDEAQGRAEYFPSRSCDQEALAGLVRDFLDGLGQIDYPRRRLDLLDFCVREGITAEDVAEVVRGRPVHGPALAECLLDDWPLRYVCKACQLFWA